MKRLLVLAEVLTLALLVPHDSQAQTGEYILGAPLAQGSQATALGGFSIVLVIGDLQAGGPASDVPPAAAKALADLKDFLPYKSYRLLDAQWTVGNGEKPVVSRLRGPEAKEYELQLTSRPVPGFRSSQGSPREVAISRFVLREVTTDFRIREDMGMRQASGGVIDTSFTMAVGETMVVGTSRVQGDKALIVLLTAVARQGARLRTF